jgi:hypothetical protein
MSDEERIHITFDHDEIMWRTLNKKELDRIDKMFDLLTKIVALDCDNGEGMCFYCGQNAKATPKDFWHRSDCLYLAVANLLCSFEKPVPEEVSHE